MIFRLLLILFITVPIFEIYLLLTIGSWLGVLPTILLIFFTAILGAFLLRLQGLSTFARVQQMSDQGQLPAIELLEGLMLLIAAALLLTPGFFTDTIGFLSLVPAIRRAIALHLLSNFFKTHIIKTNPSDSKPNDAIEGEYWEDK